MDRQQTIAEAVRRAVHQFPDVPGRSAEETGKALYESVRQTVPDASEEEIRNAGQLALQHVREDKTILEMGLKFHREGDPDDMTIEEMVSRAADEGDAEAVTFGRTFLGWPW